MATGMRRVVQCRDTFHPINSCLSLQVVLPVVARKRGLDGHYAQADGHPGNVQSKKPKDEIIEPVCFISLLL
jgi:hypothetical protein